jgi:thioredoxin 2
MPATETSLIVICPACGQKNRVDVRRSGTAVCGKCKAPLPAGGSAPGEVIELTDATIDGALAETNVPIVIDLWAPWCGPCRALAPSIKQLASEFAGRAVVAKLNVDDNPRSAHRFNASSIPLVVFLRDGREVDRVVGLAPLEEYVQRLAAQLR